MLPLLASADEEKERAVAAAAGLAQLALVWEVSWEFMVQDFHNNMSDHQGIYLRSSGDEMALQRRRP